MFAVIKTGGKQYKVAKGDEIVVEKLDAETGKDVTFGEVLMFGDGKTVTVGAPLVAGASVVGEVVDQRKGKKILIRKKRQRSTYRRTKGHRQLETVVAITAINAKGKKATPAKKAEPKADKPKAEAAPKKEKAPAKKAAPVGGADDLTKIKGIGKVFAGKLNDEGITTFAQMAALTADEIATLEDKLSASGKFENEDWVAQAADLAKDS